jgi:hypothetical protein
MAAQDTSARRECRIGAINLVELTVVSARADQLVRVQLVSSEGRSASAVYAPI